MPDCAECGKELERKTRGPFPTYCSASCRQRAYTRRKKDRDATARVIIPCPWCAFTVTAEYLVGPYVMSLGEEESVIKLVDHALTAHPRLL
jgi:endogenous inhibitor of DNA gyrase (YacG/DUF329 family)